MTSASWAMMLVVTVNAILFHAMPRFSRPDILFAVTVPDAFVAGDGRVLVFRYRAIVWSGAVAALAIGLLLPTPQPSSGQGALLMMGVVAGNMIVALAAWLLAHRKARAHAVPPSDVRVASLVPRDTSLPGGALFAVGPFAILLATALLVYAYRDEVPDGAGLTESLRWLALGVVYIAMMLTMAVSLARRTRQIAVDGLAAAAEQRFRRVNVLVLVTFWMFRVGQGGQRTVARAARQEVHGDATPDHAWKLGGLFYFNPRDPAIWVENRVGVGYTLNIGNPRAWLPIIGMMLAPMVAARLLF